MRDNRKIDTSTASSPSAGGKRSTCECYMCSPLLFRRSGWKCWASC